MDNPDGHTAGPEDLTAEAVENMQKIIGKFKAVFGSRCRWDDVPRPVDAGDRERNKALIATLGQCVKYLIGDEAMLEQARRTPELASLAHTAAELKKQM